uniref:Cadherin-related tumor suppressor-like n=1 Tax=Phallusia mammillata TaxID=59560 RepID=A0A6F9DMP2_9ASCI|nr:cadherin-related tumor suppressor-like [Phallusia mammillata]
MLPHHKLIIGLLLGLCCVKNCLGVTFSIREELEGSHSLGFIGVTPGHTYRLNPPNSLFWLNGVTGELWANKTIDREALNSDVIKLFAVADSSAPAPIEIEVTVIDINDNDPTFLPVSVTLEIPENTDAGTNYILSTATDADGPDNGISANYTIIGDTDKFMLVIDSSPGDQTLVYLRTLTEFNREDQDHYTLNISATDDGTPPRHGYLTVSVTILDRNDNTPTFDISAYTATVQENATLDSEVIVVHASDTDQGDNGVVSYRIDPNSASAAFFAINSTTGVVTLKSPLDYETQDVHYVTLEAFDGGESSLFAQALLTVSVGNVNDNDPEITNLRYFPTAASIASVDDKATAGTNVALITVSDKDNKRPSDGSLSLNIVQGNELGHFRLLSIGNGNTGLLQVIGGINRQSVPLYDLRIRVQDDGAPFARFAYQNIKIIVNSANDHSPVFSDQPYTSLLSELTPIGSCVMAVRATDNDVGLPATLRYSITSGNTLGWFRIEPHTGLVQTTEMMHYDQITESDGQVKLVISASDETSTPRTTSVELTVQLTDENDNWPRFDEFLNEVNLHPASTLTNIIQVGATDLDSGINGSISYTINYVKTSTGNVQATGLCSVDVDNGHISVTEKLVNQYTSPFDIMVQASDGAKNPLSSNTIVRVTVSRTERSEPRFYPSNLYVALSPGVYNGLEVATVSAAANNYSDNTLRYRISPTTAGLNINTVSGVVTAFGTLNAGVLRTFTVNVADGLGNIAAASANIHLVVEDNQPMLEFSRANYHFRVYENVGKRVVGQVTMSVLNNQSKDVSFSIVDGDLSNMFGIDSTSGEISTSLLSTLDREVQAQYTLTVVAALQSVERRVTQFATTTVSIDVLDINDNIPMFTGDAVLNAIDSTSSIQFYTDSAKVILTTEIPKVGEMLYNAFAEDVDTGVNGNVQYTMYDAMDLFAVDEQGIIFIKSLFSNEEFTDVVRVTACDEGAPVLCSELKLSIHVNPLLGNSVPTPTLTVTVPENAPSNSKIVNIAAALPLEFTAPVIVTQEGVENTVNFSITAGNGDDDFGIFPDGQLFLKAATLDREYKSEYDVGVTINLGRYVTKKWQVIIHVSDVNDNAPKFPQNEYVFNVMENMPHGSSVGEVRAFDPDDALASSLVYEFAPSSSNKARPFTIDRFSGKITTNCVLDKETLVDLWGEFLTTNESFSLQLQATDNKGAKNVGSHTSVVTVEIFVVDVNEFVPEFERQIYYATVGENSRKGQLVTQVTATDKDQTHNFRYKLVNNLSSFPFAIDTTSGAITVQETNALDRETQDLYTFQVKVLDGEGEGAKTGFATVQVVIRDFNDETPAFPEGSRVFEVSESVSMNSEVGRVLAIDGDQFGSVNNLVSYTLAPDNTATVLETFSVEESTGRIILKKNLDREEISSYALSVVASDNGNPVRSATATISVSVEDANDNAPELLGQTQFHIVEGNYPTATSFAKLTTRDRDAGNNARMTYQMIQQEPENNQAQISVHGSSGELFVAGTVDRESVLPGGMIRVKIRISDNPAIAADTLSTVSTVYVIIDDLNDSDPVFASPDAVFIPRRSMASIGYDITTVYAEDNDDGPNGSLSYSFSSRNGGGSFLVETATGKLELFEAMTTSGPVVQSLEVVARDQGVPSKFSTMMLRVIIGDSDLQNGPVFESSSYSGIIEENKSPGSFVASVSAPGNQVAYYITDVTATTTSGRLVRRRPFRINESSGVITTLMTLDREDGVSSYRLQITAVDLTSTRSNPRMSTTNVAVTVMDVNDNPPLFGQAVVDVILSESVQAGYKVHTLSAKDADGNSPITYTLLSSPGPTDFNIDTQSGIITVGENGLDRERNENYILRVVASDGELESSMELVVRVVDVNDHVPTFDQAEYVFIIEEGASTPPNNGKLVGIVSATDKDANENAILSYSFAEGSDQGRFKINQHTGTITINRSFIEVFDREQRDLYLLLARATDGGGRFRDVRVYVNVADTNDNAPMFHSTQTAFDVTEDSEVGLEIGTVEATDKDLGFNGTVEYKLVSGNAGGYFRIAMDSGIIYLQKMLDYETQTIHHLTVMAYDLAPPSHRLRSFLDITVRVQNIDDNPPQLVMPTLWYVEEKSITGTDLFKVGSIDADLTKAGGISGNVRYSIISQIPDNSAFLIAPISGQVYVNTEVLSQRTVESYSLTISATDKGSMIQRNIDIVVTDKNDNSPTFSSPSGYTVNVAEDADVGTSILTVTATDEDVAWNGKIQYSIAEPSSGNFKIDRESGVLYLSRKLDRESVSHETLEVLARDMGIPPRFTNTTVEVTITDVNDRQPLFAPQASVLRVNESATSAVELLTFSLRDDDAGNEGVAEYRSAIVTRVAPDGASERDNNVMSLSPSGILSINPVVDRETASYYSVLITAVDRGTPALTASASVIVIVEDLNEFAPVFRPNVYRAAVSEDISLGSHVITVNAVDQDAGVYGVVRYAIVHNGDSTLPFVVDPTTGMITTSRLLDREIKDSYTFTVSAMDSDGDNSFSATAKVIVRITDINDNAPKFELNTYQMYTKPDTENLCGAIFAQDPDSGENGVVSYWIHPDYENLPFAIDRSRGSVTTTGTLTDSFYNFTVIAEDEGIPVKTVEAKVNIEVNRGQFPNFVSSPPSVAFLENDNPTTDVLFSANTARTGAGNILFYLAGGNVDGSFTINASSGALRQTRALDREKFASFQLWIEARDSGNPQLSSFASLAVMVSDINDNAPIFTQPTYIGEVRENDLRTMIVQVSARDPDSGVGGSFTFTIDESTSESPEKFRLDSNGILRNIVRLDREEKDTYFLTVRAQDQGSDPQTSSVIVKVVVTDDNDERPTFSRLFSGEIKEDAQIGDYVVQLAATDGDLGVNSQVRYRLADSANQSFAIDPVSGLVTVNKQLDREANPEYNLRVDATDLDWTTHTSVTVTVTDVNDNPPRFDQAVYVVGVPSGTSAGSELVKVTATDRDQGVNKQIYYTMQSNDEAFRIDHSTGEIYSTRKLHCDPLPGQVNSCPWRKNLLVVATDCGSPQSLSNDVHVTITIVSPNLHQPAFANLNLPIAVLQSTPIGEKVFAAEAKDQDVGTTITYQLLGSKNSSFFVINSVTGAVSLADDLPSQSLSLLSATVRASDNGSPSLYAELDLTFEVTSPNANSPRFDRPSYKAPDVSEGSPPGTVAYTLIARDNDPGVNGEVVYSLGTEDEDKPFVIDSEKGQVLTYGEIDYEEHTSYTLTVIATDRGVIPRSSSATLNIAVSDVNDNVPSFSSPFFLAYVTESVKRSSIVTRLTAEDRDSGANALVRYGAMPQRDLIIGARTGEVSLAPGTSLDYEQRTSYQLTVSAANDGGESTSAELTVLVTGVNEFAPQFSSLEYPLVTSVNSNPGRVIFNLNGTDDDAGPDGVISYVLSGWSEAKGFRLNSATGEIVVNDGADFTVGDVVNLTAIAKNPGLANSAIVTEISIIVSIVSDMCLGQPCENGAVCRDLSNGYVCECLPGFTGSSCNVEINECDPNPCQNGGTCRDLIGKFECQCRVGFNGATCANNIDYCSEQPCLNGGTCIDGESNYTCDCPFGTNGRNCEETTLGFPATSFLGLAHLHHAANQISLSFATVTPSSLLFYNHGGESLTTFVALELINGRARLSYSFEGTRTYRITTGNGLNDGEWHQISVVMNRFLMSVSVDQCPIGDTSCASSQAHTGLSVSHLSGLGTQNLYVGGVSSIEDITSHPGQVSSYDFVGCINNIMVNNVNITGTMSPAILENQGVVDGCVRAGSRATADACISTENQQTVCGVGASCSDRWSSVLCECPDDKSGKTCQNTRVGSTFGDTNYLAYAFDDGYVQATLVESSGALFTSGTTSRVRRQTAGTTESSIQVRFRTRQNESLIAVAQGQTGYGSGALYVENGGVVYSYTEPALTSHKTNVVVSDGSWHTVEVVLKALDSAVAVTISVDGVVRFDGTSSSSIKKFSNPSQVKAFYLGGAPVGSYNPVPALAGCVYSFHVDGSPQPLADDGGSAFLRVSQGGATPGGNVTHGCTGSDVCVAQPCETDQTCVDIWEAYECECVSGNELDENGKCLVNSAALSWWIYVVIVVIVIILLLIGAYALYMWRSKKDTTTPYGICCSNESKAIPSTINGNGIAGRNNNSFESEAHKKSNGTNGSLSAVRPDLISDDVRIVDEEAVSSAAQTSSGAGTPATSPTSTRSTVNNRSLTPLHEQHEVRPSSKLSNKSASPLPDYDAIMRTRYGVADKADRASTLPPMYESERESATLGRRGQVPHGVSPLTGELFAVTDMSGNSSGSDGKYRERKRSAPANAYDSNESRQMSRLLNKSPYLQGGRTSPLKGTNTLPMTRLTPQSELNSSNASRYQTARPRRVSGSAASSSTTSSLSHDTGQPSSPSKLPTIEDMVQQLNGLVGLTSEEIELLNGNRSTHSYSDSGSITTSYPPSVATELAEPIPPPMPHIRRTSYTPAERPSSLPGRKIHRVAVGSRSKTPMTLANGHYKLSPSTNKEIYRDLPADLRPSELLQPPPDTSSDEESDIFINERANRRRSSTMIPELVEPPIMEVDDHDLEAYNSMNGLNFDFLQTYGKHYEALAGVFQQLAALPSIDDEENVAEYNTDSTQSSTNSQGTGRVSRSSTNRSASSRRTNATRTNNHPPQRRSSAVSHNNPPRTRGLSTSALPRVTSPVDVQTARPRSVNCKRTRLEHYV